MTVPIRSYVSGEAGSTWTNDTGKARWQYHVNWHNSCGVCAQNDGLIGAYWPIPIHRRCACSQSIILPGAVSAPFTDFGETIAKLPPAQQRRVVGKGNYALIESGAVEWDDVVTVGRVRTLTEVIARENLTLASTIKGGVNPMTAKTAFDRSHTPEVEADRLVARGIAESLRNHGLSTEEILRETGEQIAGRAVIGRAPTPYAVARGGGVAVRHRADAFLPRPRPPGVGAVLAPEPPPPQPPVAAPVLTTDAEMDTFAKRTSDAIRPELSREEREALSGYVYTNDEWINARLRGNPDWEHLVKRSPLNDDHPPDLSRQAEAMFRSFKSATEKFNLSEPVTVFRGTGHLSSLAGSAIEVGSVVSEAGAASTSMSEKTATRFSRTGPDPAVFKITLPKGAKAAPMNGVGVEDHTDEHEILIAPGHGKYRVTAIDRTGKILIIHAEYVDE